jgi:hypothetical protein
VVETRIGTLHFEDGAPSGETVQKAFDALDFNHALSAYLNSYGGASAYAFAEGLRSIGAEDSSSRPTPTPFTTWALWTSRKARW